MLKGAFFKEKQKDADAAAPPTTGGRLVYAIGDIHGCAARFAEVMIKILADLAAVECSSPPVLVLLGDYVDRGPASDRVLDLCCALRDEAQFELRALRGNHEDTLLEFLQRPVVGEAWCSYGGVQTLAAYGVEVPSPGDGEAAWTRARDAFAEKLPASHKSFLEDLELMTSVGDYAFVHAGVDPGRPLDNQRAHDLLWIRERFLRSRRRLDKVVVHGHTPGAEAEILGERIGLDTGAYATGVLSAIRLHGTGQHLIQARGAPQ